jgi:hypothetical protein
MTKNDLDEILKDEENREIILKELKDEYPILKQCTFSEFTINEKLQENMKLRIQYNELYEHHKYLYDKLNDKKEELICDLYDHYRFEHDRNLSKIEIEQYYLPKHPKIKKMNKILEKQKLKMDFFKLCVSSLEKLYWNIQTYVKNEKL